MTQKITQLSRHASLAIALVSLTLLALLAFRVNAQEDGAPGAAMPPVRAGNADIMRNAQEGRREQVEQMRQEGASPEEIQAAMAEARETMRNDFEQRRREYLTGALQLRATRTAALVEKRDELQQRINERRREMEEKRDTYRARLSADVQSRVGQAATGVGQGMSNALTNLESIVARVQARIDAYKAEGVDVSAAEEAFAGISDLSAAAKSDIDAFLELAAQAAASEDPKADMSAVREAASTAKGSIQLVHQALRDTVQELRNALVLRQALESDGNIENGAETTASDGATATD